MRSRIAPNTNDHPTANTCITANGSQTWYCATATSPPAALSAVLAQSDMNMPATTMSPRAVTADR